MEKLQGKYRKVIIIGPARILALGIDGSESPPRSVLYRNHSFEAEAMVRRSSVAFGSRSQDRWCDCCKSSGGSFRPAGQVFGVSFR